MKISKTTINNIPAIVWGDTSERAYIFVHGQKSCKEFASNFAEIANKKGFQTISFDLPEHGERKKDKTKCDIFNGIKELNEVYEYSAKRWNKLSLFACSIGSFFSLNAYFDKKLDNCLFQSPIVNMEYLINSMFTWFNVTKEELKKEKFIETPVETLSWDYYCFVLNNPIVKWKVPTKVLYGCLDNLQSIAVIKEFTNKFGCSLTTSEKSEHPFMQETDINIVNDWLVNNI